MFACKMQIVSDAEVVDQNCFNQTLSRHISFILFFSDYIFK